MWDFLATITERYTALSARAPSSHQHGYPPTPSPFSRSLPPPLSPPLGCGGEGRISTSQLAPGSPCCRAGLRDNRNGSSGVGTSWQIRQDESSTVHHRIEGRYIDRGNVVCLSESLASRWEKRTSRRTEKVLSFWDWGMGTLGRQHGCPKHTLSLPYEVDYLCCCLRFWYVFSSGTCEATGKYQGWFHIRILQWHGSVVNARDTKIMERPPWHAVERFSARFSNLGFCICGLFVFLSWRASACTSHVTACFHRLN